MSFLNGRVRFGRRQNACKMHICVWYEHRTPWGCFDVHYKQTVSVYQSTVIANIFSSRVKIKNANGCHASSPCSWPPSSTPHPPSILPVWSQQGKICTSYQPVKIWWGARVTRTLIKQGKMHAKAYPFQGQSYMWRKGSEGLNMHKERICMPKYENTGDTDNRNNGDKWETKEGSQRQAAGEGGGWCWSIDPVGEDGGMDKGKPAAGLVYGRE